MTPHAARLFRRALDAALALARRRPGDRFGPGRVILAARAVIERKSRAERQTQSARNR